MAQTMHQTQWVEASGEFPESGEIPGEKVAQWVKRDYWIVRCDNFAFRAQEAKDRVLLKMVFYFGFSKMYP